PAVQPRPCCARSLARVVSIRAALSSYRGPVRWVFLPRPWLGSVVPDVSSRSGHLRIGCHWHVSSVRTRVSTSGSVPTVSWSECTNSPRAVVPIWCSSSRVPLLSVVRLFPWQHNVVGWPLWVVRERIRKQYHWAP